MHFISWRCFFLVPIKKHLVRLRCRLYRTHHAFLSKRRRGDTGLRPVISVIVKCFQVFLKSPQLRVFVFQHYHMSVPEGQNMAGFHISPSHGSLSNFHQVLVSSSCSRLCNSMPCHNSRE